jgi:hypothetical protein
MYSKNKFYRYEKAIENSEIANSSYTINLDLTKIKSGKDLLPDLHNKTHFKGAETLLTDTREIKRFYNDAKLRSRFKILEKSAGRSSSLNALSMSVELPKHKFGTRLNLFERDSSIQHDAKSNMILDQSTGRSILQSIHRDVDITNQRLSKNAHTRSREIKVAFHDDEVSDYGINGGSSISNKNSKILSKKLGNGRVGLTRTKFKAQKTPKININNTFENGGSEVDIPAVTKHILTQCGFVRNAHN